MKNRKTVYLAGGLLIILALGYFFSNSTSGQVFPREYIGKWSGTHKLTLRYQNNLTDYSFQHAPDSIFLSLEIEEDGDVTGQFGEASFEECRLHKNRGWPGRIFNFATDFGIRGKLSGSIFSGDSMAVKMISIPMNINGDIISGTIFQKQKAGLYPMTDLHLTRQ